MSHRLDNKIALVTGGCGGIGRAIVSRFAAEGAQVYAADKSESGSFAHAGKQQGVFLAMDVTDEAAVKDAIAHIHRQHERLDILVNAAGIEIEKTIEETSLAEWNHIFAINVAGTFLTAKYALPLMRAAAQQNSAGAAIINFGSYDGFIADPQLAAYCATKGAIHALTKAMACDHGPDGIRVNAVCPGYIDTPMLQSFFGDSGDIKILRQAVCDAHPSRTYGTPDDIANLVSWLSSDEARYANGQLWVLDGGLTAQAQQIRI